MLTLYTIGYQGHSIETFLDLVLAHAIGQIIDVRQQPFSRKPDFSKKRLAAHLADVEIGYTHLGALGTPKELRDEVRHSHDYDTFLATMEAIIAGQPEALQTALELAQARPSALLCFEAQAAQCHRLVVARAIEHLNAGPCALVHL